MNQHAEKQEKQVTENIKTQDGVKIAADITGDADAPRIIFIHGFLQARLCWKYQMNDERFSDYRRVAYDFRGHGGSEKPEIPELYQGTEVWANELADVISATGSQKPILVGWSLGGKIILDYIKQHGQDQIAGLVLVDAPSKTGPGNRNEVSARLIGQAMSDDLHESVTGRIDFFDMCLGKKIDMRTYKECLAVNFLTPSSILRSITSKPVNHEDTLKAINIPSLVIQGGDDLLITPNIGKGHADTIRNAQYAEYAGIGHSPFVENPEQFNTDLFNFVESIKTANK